MKRTAKNNSGVGALRVTLIGYMVSMSTKKAGSS